MGKCLRWQESGCSANRPAIDCLPVGILAEPLCAVCGEVAARVEVVQPGRLSRLLMRA